MFSTDNHNNAKAKIIKENRAINSYQLNYAMILHVDVHRLWNIRNYVLVINEFIFLRDMFSKSIFLMTKQTNQMMLISILLRMRKTIFITKSESSFISVFQYIVLNVI